MPISECRNPECKKMFDLDGFGEHGVPALFYCECGKIFDLTNEGLAEVPIKEVDLLGLDGSYPLSEDRYDGDFMSRGIFIKKSRWNQTTG